MEQLIQTIHIDKLFANSWNTNIVSPDNQIKIENSIKRFGMFKPLVCRTLPDGRIEVLGGQHRLEAAKKLGYTEVKIVNLGEVDDQKAKEISLVDNSRYGSDDGLKLGELIKDLDDIGEYLPYTETELAGILGAQTVNLDDLGVLDEESDEELEKKVEEITKATPTYQIMRFKVPIEDAEFVKGMIDGICKKQGFSGSDSLTNAGDALVYLCGRRDET